MNAISEYAAYMLIFEPLRLLCAREGVILLPSHFVKSAIQVFLTPEHAVKAMLAGVKPISFEEAEFRYKTAFLPDSRMN